MTANARDGKKLDWSLRPMAKTIRFLDLPAPPLAQHFISPEDAARLQDQVLKQFPALERWDRRAATQRIAKVSLVRAWHRARPKTPSCSASSCAACAAGSIPTTVIEVYDPIRGVVHHIRLRSKQAHHMQRDKLSSILAIEVTYLVEALRAISRAQPEEESAWRLGHRPFVVT